MTKISDDGYWQLVDGNWVPTESQLQALASGAVPHTDSESNLQSVNLPVSQSVAGQQTIIYSSSNSSGPNKTLITIAVITVCSILLVTLAGILYVWASSLILFICFFRILFFFHFFFFTTWVCPSIRGSPEILFGYT